jgi:hypothetical protein
VHDRRNEFLPGPDTAAVACPLPLQNVEVRTVSVQCGILFIGRCGCDRERIAALRSLGFRVTESAEIPSTDELERHQAVVVRVLPGNHLTMLGARLRGRARFGRRVLIALVGSGVTDREKREATMSGFDLTMPDSCSARDLAAHILKVLRAYPEYRCLLRAPNGRRKAA